MPVSDKSAHDAGHTTGRPMAARRALGALVGRYPTTGEGPSGPSLLRLCADKIAVHYLSNTVRITFSPWKVRRSSSVLLIAFNFSSPPTFAVSSSRMAFHFA